MEEQFNRKLARYWSIPDGFEKLLVKTVYPLRHAPCGKSGHNARILSGEISFRQRYSLDRLAGREICKGRVYRNIAPLRPHGQALAAFVSHIGQDTPCAGESAAVFGNVLFESVGCLFFHAVHPITGRARIGLEFIFRLVELRVHMMMMVEPELKILKMFSI